MNTNNGLFLPPRRVTQSDLDARQVERRPIPAEACSDLGSDQDEDIRQTMDGYTVVVWVCWAILVGLGIAGFYGLI